MGEKLLTESEEKRIDELYVNHRKSLMNLLNEIEHEIKTKFIIYLVLLFVALPLFFYLLWRLEKYERSERAKRLKNEGFVVTTKMSVLLPYYENYYIKAMEAEAEAEACFTTQHLKYLAMKSTLAESEFRRFLNTPYTSTQLKESEREALVEIFRKVKERAENMKISDECKADLTPWEFFKDYYYRWWMKEDTEYLLTTRKDESQVERHRNVEKVYKKVFNIFKEFDKAPRISGSLYFTPPQIELFQTAEIAV